MNNDLYNSMFSRPVNIEQTTRAIDRQLKDAFKNRNINPHFMIEMLHRVMNHINGNLSIFYRLKMDVNNLIATGQVENPFSQICKMIIGCHRSNTWWMTVTEEKEKRRNESYKEELTQSVLSHVFLNGYASYLFRREQIYEGEEWLFYPLPYDLFVMCMTSNKLLNTTLKNAEYRNFYAHIFTKGFTALTVLESNILDSAYPICRSIIEVYIKLLVLLEKPTALSEYNQFTSWQVDKNRFGIELPEDFQKKFSNRNKKVKTTVINYLHYGWVDSLEDYHNVVKQVPPYSMAGLFSYIKATNTENTDELLNIEYFYKICHAYVHGSDQLTSLSFLHYMEISLMLYFTIARTFEKICRQLSIDPVLADVQILDKAYKDFTFVFKQYQNREIYLDRMENI